MNVIAILNHMGVYFKEEPIRELHRALERLNFQIVYPNDRDDLLKLIENNARLCGVIFDWDKYNLELCEEISKMNENLPLYAFANTYSTLDVSLNDLRLQISFFEYALGAAEDIANKIKQTTDEYINTILPPLTKALFKYVREGKYTFCTPGHMGGTAFQKSPVG
ncbi:TPA: Orn/Lys/Arg decarboxylase N-terminal domain-containing protein, partial [Escherichia coli]